MEGWVGLSTKSVNNLLKVITRKRYWCDSNCDPWVTSLRPYHYATEPPACDWLLVTCINAKTVVYTHVNGDTFIKNSTNHKQVTLPIITSPNVNVLLNNITFLWFLLFFTCMSPLIPSSQLGHWVTVMWSQHDVPMSIDALTEHTVDICSLNVLWRLTVSQKHVDGHTLYAFTYLSFWLT